MEEMVQANVTTQYRDILIWHLDALTILYRDLLRKYANLAIDNNLFNECIAEMVTIMDHLVPKLKGSGKKAEPLIKDFEEFEKWRYNITIPKININETKKVHKLFNTILAAYDLLGLTKL